MAGDGAMNVVIAARCHANRNTWCHACGSDTMVALLTVQPNSTDAPLNVRLCAGCCKAAWFAARKIGHKAVRK